MEALSVFAITNLKIHDPVPYKVYEKGFFPLLKKYGGEFITYDDNPITLEGINPRSGRMIIFKFPSEEIAKNWYHDPDYQSLINNRLLGTTLEFLTRIHGLKQKHNQKNIQDFSIA